MTKEVANLSRKKRKNKVEKAKIQKKISKLWLATILGFLVLITALVAQRINENEKFPWKINWQKTISFSQKNETVLSWQISLLIADYRQNLELAISRQNEKMALEAFANHYQKLAALAKDMSQENFAQEILTQAETRNFYAFLATKLEKENWYLENMTTQRSYPWGKIKVENLFIAPIIKIRKGAIEGVPFTIYIVGDTQFVYDENKSALTDRKGKIVFLTPKIIHEAASLSEKIGRRVSPDELEHIQTIHELQHLLDAHHFTDILDYSILETRAALKTLSCPNISKKIIFANIDVWQNNEDQVYVVAYRTLIYYMGENYRSLSTEEITKKAALALTRMDQEINKELHK